MQRSPEIVAPWKVKTGHPDNFKGLRAEYKTFLQSMATWPKKAYPNAREYITWLKLTLDLGFYSFRVT